LFIANKGRICTSYLRYWFRLPSVWRRVENDCTGSTPTTRNRYKEQFFLSLEVPLPPLAEQQAIVSQLDTLADKVRQVNEHLDLIEERSSAMFLSLHHKLAGNRRRKLCEIIELHEESVPIRPDDEYPQVGVRGFGGGLFPKDAVAGSGTSYRTFNRLYAEALVLSQVKGWEGALALCPSELAGMYVSPEYRTFRCIPGEAAPGYLGELVLTPWFWSLLQGATRGVGARRERTRPEQFLNIELPMPQQDKQLKVRTTGKAGGLKDCEPLKAVY
jgi:type I restriction enzyme S subunit